MTAGSGIIHQEMPQATDHLLGCQIWLNLPARDKMVPPQYNDILDADVPVIGGEGVKIHIIAGRYKDFVGAFEGKYVEPLYLDVEAQPGVEWHLETDPDNTLFVYIISGEAAFDPNNSTTISEKNVVLLSTGEQFWMRAGRSGVRFLLLSGRPLNEPIAWGGPIVMNTRQELSQAFRDLEEENFIK
jgi:redox-sensitive bicupin YhaK (pirin superfamily)